MKARYLIFIFAILFSCATISNFDQYAYTQTTSVKVDALNLMSFAVEDYKLHEKEAVRINTEIEKIYEYEKNRPKNEFTTHMWEILKDTTRNLYGGFITRWKTEGRLGRTFINEKKKQIGDSFDQIAQLESKKIKPSAIKN